MPDVFFVASYSNGIKTDEQWRCAHFPDKGWFLPNYTDVMFWPKASLVNFGSNTHVYFMAPDAKWIGHKDLNNKIYCRRNLNTGKN